MLHHHDRVDGEGLLLPTGIPAADRAIDRVNGTPRAWRCVTSIATLPEDRRYEVVFVADGSGLHDELLAQMDGDVKVVRRPPLSPAAVAEGAIGAAEAPDVLVLSGAPAVTEAPIGALAGGRAGTGPVVFRTTDGGAIAALSRATTDVPVPS